MEVNVKQSKKELNKQIHSFKVVGKIYRKYLSICSGWGLY